LAFGLGATIALYICGAISGGHINPAISVAMSLLGRLSWYKLPFYLLAQYLGGFVGAGMIYVVYYDALNKQFAGGNKQSAFEYAQNLTATLNETLVEYDLAHNVTAAPQNITGDLIQKTSQMTALFSLNTTAGIFATYPSFPDLTQGGALVDEIFGTFLLVLAVMALTDRRNQNVPQFLVPVLVGSTIAAISMAYGYNTNFAINPARDFGPRVFTYCAGWGSQVFTSNHYYFWIPIVGPHLGAILGALIYWVFIEAHWPKEEAGLTTIKIDP